MPPSGRVLPDERKWAQRGGPRYGKEAKISLYLSVGSTREGLLKSAILMNIDCENYVLGY